jgi:hypothetical protein
MIFVDLARRRASGSGSRAERRLLALNLLRLVMVRLHW